MNHHLFLVAILLLIPHSPTTTAATKWWILNICSHTSDAVLCSSIFNRFTKPETDIVGLTEIAITQTLKSASNFRSLTREALATEKSTRVRQGYETCGTLYEQIVDEFKDATLDFKRGDYSSLSMRVSTCFKYVDDCFKALQNLSGQASQLRALNVQNRVLLQMSLSCAYNVK